MPDAPLLKVEALTTRFVTRDRTVAAVDDVSFEIRSGETLGIVGESGSGKSVTCQSVLRLIPSPPGRIDGGRAWFDGQDLLKLPAAALRRIRGDRIGMIFQDPMTSLNPYLKISTQMIENLRVHRKVGRKDALHKAIAALEEVGIPDAARRVHSYPHEFSGGMRQRVMIAMALLPEPDLLIADEPTTALDVTVQAQILDIIKRRQADLGTAVILITHDLGVVAGTCDRVQVMYAGRVVESGTTDQIFYAPRHPYARTLQRAMPSLGTKGERLFTIDGLPPDLSRPVKGCSFYPRCPYPKCGENGTERPPFVLTEDGHGHAACGYCDPDAPITTGGSARG